MIRKSTHILIGEILQDIERTVEVDFIDVDITSKLHTVYTCNTLWLTISEKTITINGNDYKVKTVSPFPVTVNNVTTLPYIVLEGDQSIVVTEFEIPLPTYYHGTILRVLEELNQVPLSWDKLPFMYLRGEIKESFIEDGSDGDSNFMKSACRIYFMAETNVQDWTSNEHESLVVAPMRNLAEAFVNALRKSEKVGLFDNYQITNKVKWGIYEDRKGNVDQIFKEFMSGCELDIEIPFTRTADCCIN